MLEGSAGLYDFADYIHRVPEARSISFVCHKGNLLIGPPKATCANGSWKPSLKPKCVSQRHPDMEGQIIWSRNRRHTLNNLMEPSNSSEICPEVRATSEHEVIYTQPGQEVMVSTKR